MILGSVCVIAGASYTHVLLATPIGGSSWRVQDNSESSAGSLLFMQRLD